MSRVLVLIHGAGKQPSTYHDQPVADLTAILGHRPQYRRCWYADLSDVGTPVRGVGDSLAAFGEQFRHQVEASLPRVGDIDLARIDVSTLAEWKADTFSDVARYLYDETLQGSVRQRLIETLDSAAGLGEIVLVSHSLGSVVAYDVLREHAANYPIHHFMTCGCPLLKVTLSGARPADRGAIEERTVPSWRNLYDLLDPVANIIGPAFPGYPVQDVFVPAVPGVDKHDYWSRDYVLRLIADYLR